MRAYENKNEFTEKNYKKSTQKQREQMKISKKILQKTDGAILNDKKRIFKR